MKVLLLDLARASVEEVEQNESCHTEREDFHAFALRIHVVGYER
jgi:hypothetical protein